MIVIIVMLLIGVILRWGFISDEAGKAFKERIDHFKAPQGQSDTLPEADSAGWNVIRDTIAL